MNQAAGASSSNPDDASLDLSFSEDGRSGTFMIGNESFPASLLDLPTVMESYKTYNDSVLIKTADIGQMIMVREEDDPAPEGIEYTHGLTPPMRDARRRRFRREPDLNVFDAFPLAPHGSTLSIITVIVPFTHVYRQNWFTELKSIS
uniref:TAFII55 protein conserved region domain-containing protein n=1 Tax=Oryza barthii TaxID=65489 RepID=A0A0D3ERU8_9ORYZ